MMFYGTPSGRRVDRLLPLIILLGSFLPGSLRAQAQPPPAPPAAAETAPQKLTQEQLNQLFAPIALYPDALIALILPASTVPSDLVLAARFLSSNGDPAQVANQPWDDSVKSLVRYPDVVKWMDQNLEWTTQVGEAFLDQPADVMNSIQQLRAQARAAGNLIDTPQQRIVEQETYIRIVPAEPEVIYVPQYDPEVVYVQAYEPYPYAPYPYAPYFGPALTFGIGFAVGPWLNYDCDWPRRRVCVGDWNPRWNHDWNPKWKHDSNRGGRYEVSNTVNVVNINSNTARVWQPSPKIQRQHWQRQRNYNASAFNKNFRGSKGANDAGQRFAAVVKPSRPQFDGRRVDGNRQAWRRSNRDAPNLARNLPGEIRRPRSRAPNVIPGPEPGQTEQNFTRESKRGKEQSGRQSNAMVKRNVESFARGQQARQSDNFQSRRLRADSPSVKTSRSLSSANGDRFRSQHSKRSVSKANSDSRHQFKTSRASSSSNLNQSRSQRSRSVHSRAKDSSQQFKRGQSRSFHSQGKTPSYSKSNKSQHSARFDRSGGRSQRSAQSYSRPNRQQVAGGGGKGGGGGKHKSGDKGEKRKD